MGCESRVETEGYQSDELGILGWKGPDLDIENGAQAARLVPGAQPWWAVVRGRGPGM